MIDAFRHSALVRALYRLVRHFRGAKVRVPKPITEYETYTLEDPDRPGVEILVAEVPDGLSTTHEARHQYDDRSVAVPHGMGSIWFTVIGPRQVVMAHATFGGDQGKVQCCTIEVEPAFRKQGLATLLYLLASDTFAAPVIPSDNRTAHAIAFWNGRTEISA
ncbi:hypothetical protein NI454_10110 [Brevundimonas diminuta]|nr:MULTISPECIES: hypothetical protein [Brevundimonas]MCO8030303.1 hypothetical protein [Brevundimonas diminuta]HCW48603.1 hypothetical protein [Brevundimonas sp.]